MKWVTRLENVSATTNFRGPSDPNGLIINYYLKTPASGDVTVQVMKGARVVAENKKAPNAAGVNKIVWNLRMDAVTIPGRRRRRRRAARLRRRMGARRRGRPGDPDVRRHAAGRPGRLHHRPDGGRQDGLEDRGVLEDVWFDRMF